MFSQADRRIAREFHRRSMAIVPVLDLRVFGSRARGDNAPDSDLDLFIELEEVTPELREQISEIAWEVGFEMDRVICTVVATRKDLKQSAMGANLLVFHVEQEGVRP
jgi:predicted nucleotidyltransferase